MPTHFVFVDETGDLGLKGTQVYGYGVLEVAASDYGKIRAILAEERWRFRLYRDFELKPAARPVTNVLMQLQELAECGKVFASGLYINKARYGGSYLTWSDIRRAKRSQWVHRLRNYLLRHALEFHYSSRRIDESTIDLVLDRIAISRDQQRNLEDYIMSRKAIQLREPFRLPNIDYVTISDSSYTGGLQLAHLIAELLKKCASDSLEPELRELVGFIRIVEFLGHAKPLNGSGSQDHQGGGATHRGDPPPPLAQ